MFNGLFNNGCGGTNDCTWLILIALFMCCCCGGNGQPRKTYSLKFTPCCLLAIAGILCCTGAITQVDNGNRC